MKYRELNSEHKQDILEMWSDNSTSKEEIIIDICDKYDAKPRTIYDWIKNINDESIEIEKDITIVSTEAKKIKKLQDENQQLRKAINEAKSHVIDSDDIKKILYDVVDFEYIEKEVPDFNNLNAKVSGIPVLMLSDLHYGEVVSRKEVNNMNSYNSSIAEDRINYTVDSAIKIVTKDWTAYDTEWIVVPLMGDCLSGTIHEELTETNDKTVLVSMIDLADILIYQIEKLNKHFDKVYVPCVVGNHPRLHKKFRAKRMVEENYEYIMYKIIERHFSTNKNVVFDVSEQPDLRFDIFNKRFLLSHGNTLGGGGGGIAGILPLLYRGNYKKQERATSLNNSYDILLIGHWHQSLFLNKVIVNGTTKGIDEYALNLLNVPYEPPSQNLFMVDRKYGEITYRLPVYCEEPKLESSFNKITTYK